MVILRKQTIDSDEENSKDKKDSKKEIDKLKKMASALEKEKKICKKLHEARRVLFYTLIFDKYSQLKQNQGDTCPTSIFQSFTSLDSGFLGIHLLPRIQLSYSDALSSAFFIKSLSLFNAKSLTQYVQIIGKICHLI
jgi:hypothetical protein